MPQLRAEGQLSLWPWRVITEEGTMRSDPFAQTGKGRDGDSLAMPGGGNWKGLRF